MGKLKKVSILLAIVILFALVIVSSTTNGISNATSNIRALLFNQKSNNATSSTSRNGAATAMPSQSFGRGFSNTSPHRLERLGEVADPNYKITFPKDHYSHDSFDIEWWYLTANLQDGEGNAYGLQWTLFRFRNPNVDTGEQKTIKDSIDGNALNPENKSKATKSNWSNEHLYMAHASVHSASKHWFSEKFARGNVGNAGVDQTPFKLFIDDWQWTSPTAGLLPAKLTFNAKLISNSAEISETSYLKVQLNLSNTGPYVLQGQRGYSIKSANGEHASHYYSAPFINIDGTFTMSEALTPPDLNPNRNLNELDRQINNSAENVITKNIAATNVITTKQLEKSMSSITSAKQIAVKGNAWFDQEWTSQLFDQATLGWDWLSLHLDNGDKIMAFRMRLQGPPDYITGTYIHSDGSTTTLMPSDIELNAIELTAVGNKKLPLYWQLKIESKGLEVSIKATKNDQWNPASIAYYEGTVAVSGTHKGKGFLELTGY